MTWTRLDDGWCERQVFEELPYEARWHYLAMIQFCSRNHRYDGVMRGVDARRCSDLDDPATAVAMLAAAGLLEVSDTSVRVVHIEEFIPPPHLRDEERKRRQREEKRRSRLHRSGDHSICLPSHCPHSPTDVTADVSTDTGTGQDRTGRDGKNPFDDNAQTDNETVSFDNAHWHHLAADHQLLDAERERQMQW